MYKVPVDNVVVKRSCTPLYEYHQATPNHVFLDEDEEKDVYSGMVMYRTGPETVAVFTGQENAVPMGLAALDRNSDIDDTDGVRTRAFAVWTGSADAEFEVTTPAFDDGEITDSPSGEPIALYADGDGKLTTDDTNSPPVAQLLEVVNDHKIRVSLLPPAGTTIS